MKKLFLFTVALLTSLMVGATIHTLEPGENKIETAIASAQAGDVIELTGDANHVYTEWNHIVIDKTITIRAAEGATPKVKIHYVDINASFEANGIQFISHNTAYYWFQTTTGGTFDITFKGCTFTDCVGNYIYYLPETQSISSLTIDNCIMNTAAEGENDRFLYTCGVINNFTMINSTIMNHPGGYPCYVRNVAVSLLVDHCTFYNNGNRPLLLGDKQCPINACVKNCVVSNPATVENYCIATYAGTVENCVYYNTSAPRSSSSTNTNCINADPQFIDPANGNFNFAFTSPLFLAATDGSNIGDPRWGVKSTTSISVPNTLSADEAVLTGPKITKTVDGITWGDNSNADADYASWVIDVAKAGIYEVVINVSANSTSTHNYSINLYSTEGLISSSPEASATSSTGARSVGNIAIENAGQYLIRLTNGTPWSSAIVESVEVKYAGGAVINIPATLPNDDAVLYGPKIKKTEDGIAWNDNGDAAADYAVWNVNVDKAGDYIVKMTVSKINSSGHTFSLDIYDGDSQQVGNTINEPSGEVTLAAGNYTIRLNNGTPWSSAVMESVSIFYKGGAVMPIPGILPGEEAVLTSQMIRLANGSFQWPNKNDHENHYATWNVTAAAAGEVDVTLHVGMSSSGHCFTVGLYEGETLKASISEDATAYSTGTLLLGSITIPAAGSYTIRLNNTVPWSFAIVDSIKLSTAVAPTVITIEDDTEVDFTAYEGQIVTIKLIRTFKANMYNPICLPFALSSSALSNILKADKSYVLGSASLEEQKLYVELQEGNDIYQGTPYMIKPSEDVENPVFTNVEIKTTSPDQTTKGVLRLQGSFASHAIDNPQNALLVGANNTLFFPNDETPYIKSMRAYFILVGQAVGAPIKSACFREPGNAPTWMEVQNAECTMHNGKFIRNGRFVIVREGKEYNALGVGR